jgi:hypothetical protein
VLKDLLEMIASSRLDLLRLAFESFDGLLDDNSLWRLSLNMNKATVSWFYFFTSSSRLS